MIDIKILLHRTSPSIITKGDVDSTTNHIFLDINGGVLDLKKQNGYLCIRNGFNLCNALMVVDYGKSSIGLYKDRYVAIAFRKDVQLEPFEKLILIHKHYPYRIVNE